jgi:CRP-like cAMP-binding protein
MPAWDGRAARRSAREGPVRDLLGGRAMEGISCGFCHQVHGPVGRADRRGYQGNPTWTSFVTGATFEARPEDARGLFGIANSGYELRPRSFCSARRQSPREGRGAARRSCTRAVARGASYLRSSEFCGSCHDVRLFGTDALGARRASTSSGCATRTRSGPTGPRRGARRARPRRAARTATCRVPGRRASPTEGGAGPIRRPAASVPLSGHALRRSARPASYPKGARRQLAPRPVTPSPHYFSGVDLPLARDYPRSSSTRPRSTSHGVPLSAKKRRDLLLRATFRFELDGARRSGGTLEIPVVIENIGAGHKVPAGFSQEREIWVHLTVRDGRARALRGRPRRRRRRGSARQGLLAREHRAPRSSIAGPAARPLRRRRARRPRHPEWSTSPAEGGTRFRGRGPHQLPERLPPLRALHRRDRADGSCQPGPGRAGTARPLRRRRLRPRHRRVPLEPLGAQRALRDLLPGRRARREPRRAEGARRDHRHPLAAPGRARHLHVRARDGRAARPFPSRRACSSARSRRSSCGLHRLRARAGAQGRCARAARSSTEMLERLEIVEVARARGGGAVIEAPRGAARRGALAGRRRPRRCSAASTSAPAARSPTPARSCAREAGAAVYRAGDPGDSFFVVAEGRVALRAVKRGDDGESEIRAAGPGASFGEESTIGSARRATAWPRSAPSSPRSPCTSSAAPRPRRAAEHRRAHRAGPPAQRDARLCSRTLALTRDLPAASLDTLLDAVAHRSFERGEAVYEQGAAPSDVWLIADGLVQIQTEEDGRLHVRAYLSRGDFFGDAEVLEGGSRARPRWPAARRASSRSPPRCSRARRALTPSCLVAPPPREPLERAPARRDRPRRQERDAAPLPRPLPPPGRPLAPRDRSLLLRALRPLRVGLRGHVRRLAARAPRRQDGRARPRRPRPRRASSCRARASTARTPRAWSTAPPARSAAIPRARCSSATPSAPAAARARRPAPGTTSRWRPRPEGAPRRPPAARRIRRRRREMRRVPRLRVAAMLASRPGARPSRSCTPPT